MIWASLIAAVFMAHGEAHHHNHGNPDDFADYLAKMDEPGRAEWQKPDEVVKALAVGPGQVACDIGTGPGYFALRIAKTAGHVFAVDVEPRMLEELRKRIAAAHAGNVTPVLSNGDDPLLPERACDLILVVDTYHHFEDGPAYLRRLGKSLKPGGKLVNIDFHKRANPVGPKIDHLIAREAFLDDAAKAGFKLAGEQTFLPYQYFLVLAPK